MERLIKTIFLSCLLGVMIQACQKDPYFGPVSIDNDTTSVVSDSLTELVLIGCEGNFQYANASLSVYDPSNGDIENDLYQNNNISNLGDVLQSMAQKGDSIFLVVNNSNRIRVVDRFTWKEVTTYESISTPRYMGFIDHLRVLVSGYETHELVVLNLQTHAIEQSIAAPAWTERITSDDKYFYVEGKSDSSILIIDRTGLEVTNTFDLGFDPVNLMLEENGSLLVAGNTSSGSIIKRLNPSLTTSEVVFELPNSMVAFEYQSGEVYVLSQKQIEVFDMSGTVLHQTQHDLSTPYAMYLDESNIYLSDVKDYLSKGEVHIFNLELNRVDRVSTGIIPQSFLSLNRGV